MNAILLIVVGAVWGLLYVAARRLHRISVSSAQAGRQTSFISRHSSFIAEVIGATGLLALATIGFFWQILFSPNTWMPAGGGDLAPFLYPNYRFAAEHLRQGVIPLWNPHLYSGTPFAADIQSGLFYPINLLVFALVPNLTYAWLQYLAIFHFWLAGATMYVCLRLLVPAGNEAVTTANLGSRVAPLAAFAGALAFEFSDLFIVHFGNLNMIAVAAWLPLIFILFYHSLDRKSPGLAAASGAVLAVATLAGHIQITLFILLALGLYALWFIVVRRSYVAGRSAPALQPQMSTTGTADRHVSPKAARLYPLTLLLVTFGVTIGLSALLLLPAYELSQHTTRAEISYEEAARFSLHPVQMVGLLVPNFFGRDPALHWGPWERVETGYIGIITLMLALIGAFLYPGWLKAYFIGLGALSLLLAMGGYTLVHGWLYATVPGFDQLRAPARFILLLDFSLATLAAFGLQQLLHPLTEKARKRLAYGLKILAWVLGGLLIVALPLSYFAMLITQDRNPAIFNRAVGAASGLVLFAIFSLTALLLLYLINKQWLREKWAGLAVIVLLGLDLFTLGYNVDVGHTDPTAGFDHPEAMAFLQQDPNLFRLEVTTDVWHAWQPNTAILYDLYDAWGLYNPLTLANTTLFWSAAGPRSSGRYNFLGIKYIIASKAGAPADGDIVSVFEDDPQINIYLNQSALPPALFVGRTEIVASHGAAWEAVLADNFDPRTSVILEHGPPLDNTPNSSLSILHQDLHSLTVAVETDQPGYLVVPRAYYPGWQAVVSGQPEPIRRANYAFQAVYVPAGQHTVRFTFEPLLWKIGLAVTGVTTLLLVGWMAWHRRGSLKQ